MFNVCYTRIPMCRFPHSDICGLSLICSSPQLFAACHVLHRLPVPRHSPCALFHLTFSSLTYRGLPPFRPVELYETFLKSSFQSPLRQNCNLTLLTLLYLSRFSLSFPLFNFQGALRNKTNRPRSPACSSKRKSGGLRWTRTIDLTLIRRAL